MTKKLGFFATIFCFLLSNNTFAQSDKIEWTDLKWDTTAPAGMSELIIPSGKDKIAGLMYYPNGKQKHPTLLMLHGFPGNEKNLDLAQFIRAHGWNVIYFNYRGSWGSQGIFSFMNCVQDVKNVVAYCTKFQDSLRIDINQIALFGHSMGGWVCLKALEEMPQIKKGFALSTWDIYSDLKLIPDEKTLNKMSNNPENPINKIFVLNASSKDIFLPAYKDKESYNLATNALFLIDKKIMMLDEHDRNKALADTIKSSKLTFFDYKIWNTDHSFTNKRISLMNTVLEFLND